MPDDEPRAKRDLTSGSISGAIWTLALPTIVANTAHTTITLVDRFWIGKLSDGGPAPLAAITMCGQVIFLVFTVFFGVSMAAGALVARATGAKDVERADHVAGQSLVLAFALAAGVGAVGFVFAPELLRMLRASDDVVLLGTGYLRITFAAAPAVFALAVGGGILRGAGDAVTPLVISIIAAVVNLVLDPFLIFGLGGLPRMGVRGAALASVIAQALAFGVGFAVLTSGRLKVRIRLRDFRVDPGVVWLILSIGLPAVVQMSMRALMGVVLIGIIAGFGKAVVAALGIGMALQGVAFMPTFGIAEASGALVGQNLGAGKPDRAKRSALVSTFYTISVMGLTALLFSWLAPFFVRVFSVDVNVIEAGVYMLRITAPGLVFAAIGITLGRAIGGAGDTVPTAVFTFVALWGIQVPLAIWLSGYATFGETGVWWAGVVAGAILCSMTATYFFSGRWKRKKV